MTGPWSINKPRADRSNSAQVLDADGYVIAECPGYASSTGTQAKDNARLIAAAPDLLAALEMIAAKAHAPGMMTDIALRACARIASAAIAAARDENLDK